MDEQIPERINIEELFETKTAFNGITGAEYAGTLVSKAESAPTYVIRTFMISGVFSIQVYPKRKQINKTN